MSNSVVTKVIIPASCTSLAEGLFNDCPNITEILVEAGNTTYSSENGILYNYDKTTLIRVPEGFPGNSEDTIANIDIPSTVTRIENYAFYNCTYTATIPANSPYSYATVGLKVNIPDSVTYIGNYAFYGSNVGYVNNYNYDYSYTFTIPNSVSYIGDHAFHNCQGGPKTLTSSSLKHIGDYAFAGSDYKNSNNIYLEMVNLDNIEYIGEYAFAGSSEKFTSMSFGSKLSYIGAYAFVGPQLKDFTIKALVPPAYGDQIFYYYNPYDVTNCTIKVPASSYLLYKNAWGKYLFSDGSYFLVLSTIEEGVILPDNINTGNVVLGNSSFFNSLNAKKIESKSSISYALINDKTTDIIAGYPQLKKATIKQYYFLYSNDINTPNAKILAPRITSKNKFLSNNILIANPIIEQTSIKIGKKLYANNLTINNPVLSKSTINQSNNLSGKILSSGALKINSPIINQKIFFNEFSIITRATISSPILKMVNNLSSNNIITSNPILINSILSQSSVLKTNGLSAQSILLSPTIRQTNKLLTNNIIASVPILISSAIYQKNNLKADKIISSKPILISSTIIQISVLKANSFNAQNPILAISKLNQIDNFIPKDISTNPVLIGPKAYIISGTNWEVTYNITTPKTISIDLSNISDVYLHWGDGPVVEDYTSNGIISHTYTKAGTYKVKAWGFASKISFSNNSSDIVSAVLQNDGLVGEIDISDAFIGSQISTITIPKTVKTISDTSFLNCSNLSEIIVDDANTNYISSNGVLYNRGLTSLIKYPENKSDYTYSIADTVTSIINNAFINCKSLIRIIVPSSTLVSLGTTVFDNHSDPISIDVPYSLYANYLVATNWINYADIINYIGTDSSLFDFNSNTGFILGYNSTNPIEILVPKYITVNNTLVKVIGITDYAFYNYNTLTNIVLPNSITTIGGSAFGKTSITSIVLPSSLTTLEDAIFLGCDNLSTISIGENSYFTVEDNILYNKDKTTLIYYPPKKVDTSFTLPETVTKISDYAFDNCDNLTYIKITNTTPQTVYSSTFTNNNLFIEVGYDYVSTFKAAWPIYAPIIKAYYLNGEDFIVDANGIITSYLGTEAGILVIPAIVGATNVLGIASSTFVNNSSFTSVTIPSAITSIDAGTFSNCLNLVSFTVEAGNASYSTSNDILFNIDKTKLIAYPINKTGTSYNVTATSLEDYCFKNSINLTSITNIPNLGIGMFDNTKISSIIVPSTTTSIPDYCFKNCNNLSSITDITNVVSIGISAFENTNFAEFIIPIGVTSIGNKAFYNCNNLSLVKDYTLTPATIGTNVFGNHNSYLKIRVRGTVVDTYKASWSDWSSIIKSIDSVSLLSIFDDTDFKAEFNDTIVANSNMITKDFKVKKVVNGSDNVDLYIDYNSDIIGAEIIYFNKLNI